jgi:hypothetical protein
VIQQHASRASNVLPVATMHPIATLQVPNTNANSTLGKPPADWGRIHGTGGAYGIFGTDSAGSLQYEHVANAGNHGKGKVMETWSITEASHAQPKAPPGPPSPPAPAPPSPPAPTPAGMVWECHKNEAYNPPAAAGLTDEDINEDAADIIACTGSCNGKGASCVAVRYHGTDKHCSLLSFLYRILHSRRWIHNVAEVN